MQPWMIWDLEREKARKEREAEVGRGLWLPLPMPEPPKEPPLKIDGMRLSRRGNPL